MKPVWEIDRQDPMIICVWASLDDHELDKPPVMRIFLGEAMEAAGRIAVMAHIDEIESSPWITRWHSGVTYDILREPEKS